MTEAALADTAVLLPYRWRQHHLDVCAVLTLNTVEWVIRDLLVAATGEPGGYAADPGHDPLVAAKHLHAHTWSFDVAQDILPGGARAEELLGFLWQRETALAAIGHGNVIRQAMPPEPLGGQTYTVRTAAQLLDRDAQISLGEARLFELLQVKEWVIRRGLEFVPSRTALTGGYLAATPRRVSTDQDLYPQIALTIAGLVHLHALLGGSNPNVLEQEPRP